MTITAAFAVLALTGFDLSWNSLPAVTGEAGSAEITVSVDENELVAVHLNGNQAVSYEITATIDGGDFLRRGSRIENVSYPVSEVLVYESLESGRHIVSVTLTDIESGKTTTGAIAVFIDAVDGSNWSSGGLRISPDGPVRASGYVSLLWNVYIPCEEDVPSGAYALLNKDADVILEGWLASDNDVEGVIAYSSDVSLLGLEKGRYRFTVASLQRDSLVASSSSSITILESWDIWGDTYSETNALIRPIASVHELRELERAGGQGDRNSVMADFWASRDPDPATRGNRYLDSYLLKLDRISREFGTTGIRGINSDRGVVYAKMGEPDIVENFVFEHDSYPRITWEYFTPSLSITFVDRDGYGYYEIVEGWDVVDKAFNSREELFND